MYARYARIQEAGVCGQMHSVHVMKAVYRHTLADHEAEAVQATHDHFDALMGPC